MTQYLRQSTAATLKLGPFIDDTGAATTALTISQADVRLSKNGGNMAQKNEATSCTHDEIGFYDCPVDTTDTNTLGRLDVMVAETGSMIVVQSFTIIPADIYDQMFTANANRGVIIAAGTIGSTGNSTTALHLTGLTYGDDELNNMLIVIKDVSAGERHARWITDWADTGDLATVATLPFTPENAVDTYEVLAIRQDVTGGSGLDAAGVRSAIGLASANLDTQLAAIDDAIDTEVAAILADTNELQTDWANGGRLDLILDARASQASVDTIDDFLDTEVAAILADTNELQTDWANGGRLDLILDSRASQASVDTIDDFLDTEITSILNRLPAALTADGNMKSDILRVVGIALQAAGGGTSSVGEV